MVVQSRRRRYRRAWYAVLHPLGRGVRRGRLGCREVMGEVRWRRDVSSRPGVSVGEGSSGWAALVRVQQQGGRLGEVEPGASY